MECVDCGSMATSERRDRTAQGYRRFRCRDCGRQFNERSGGLLNRTQYPSDVIALVVLWRLAGKFADWTSIDYVYEVCSFLPLMGLLAAFLPDPKGRVRQRD